MSFPSQLLINDNSAGSRMYNIVAGLSLVVVALHSDLNRQLVKKALSSALALLDISKPLLTVCSERTVAALQYAVHD